MNKRNELLVKGTDIKIFKTVKCIFCGEEFIVTDLEKKLLDREGFKYPEHCPLCNFKLLYSLLNDTKLYKIKDSDSKNEIISTYSEYTDYKIIDAKKYKELIENDEFLKYGISIGDDIFGDFKELFNDIPRPSRLIYPSLENADYSSHSGWAKNLYLSFCVFIDCEDVFHSFNILLRSKDIFYSANINNSTNVYNSNYVIDSHNIFYSDDVKNSSDLLFCKDMESSKECIFSCNKVNAEYLVFNKQYLREEYKKIKKYIFDNINENNKFKFLINRYKDFLKTNYIKSSVEEINVEKTSGHKLSNVKNSANIYQSSELEDSVNSANIVGHGEGIFSNSVNTVEGGGNCSNIIGTCSFGPDISSIFFSFGITENCHKIYYSYDIEGCEEIMFSVGLKNKKYCILNKQYQKEEYFKLKEQIIKKLKHKNRWGDPLPLYLENYPYNDTSSFSFFGVNNIEDSKGNITIDRKKSNGIVKILSEDYISDAIIDFGSGLKNKIKWRNKENPIDIPDSATKINSDKLPSTKDASNDVLTKIIICQKTNKPYRIMKQELDFFKKHNLPLPKYHYSYIINDFMYESLIGKLEISNCDKCSKEILYAGKNGYKMYCKDCYNEFMYA